MKINLTNNLVKGYSLESVNKYHHYYCPTYHLPNSSASHLPLTNSSNCQSVYKHRFCHCHFNFIINLYLILNFYMLSLSFTKMVRTRSQLENLSKEEMIKELITVNDMSSKPCDLSNPFDFLMRFEVVSSNLAIATAIAY